MKKLHFNDKEFERVLLYSLKYAIGRRTYIVSLTTDYIRSHLPYLTQYTVDAMVNAIKEYSDSVYGKPYGMGDPCDEMEWSRLYKELSLIKDKKVKKKEVDFSNHNTSLMICSAIRYGRNSNDICALQEVIRLVIPYLSQIDDKDIMILYQDVSEPFYGTMIIGDDVIFYQQLLVELAKRNISLPYQYKVIGSWVSPLLGIPLDVPFQLKDEDETKYILLDEGFEYYSDSNIYRLMKPDLLLGLLQHKFVPVFCEDSVSSKQKNVS